MYSPNEIFSDAIPKSPSVIKSWCFSSPRFFPFRYFLCKYISPSPFLSWKNYEAANNRLIYTWMPHKRLDETAYLDDFISISFILIACVLAE